MNQIRAGIISVFLFASFSLFSQKLKKSDQAIVNNLKTHIAYLADDKLEGRRAGTAGEALAMEYITKQFQQIGLEKKGTDGYAQPFAINDGKEIKESSYLTISGNKLVLLKDYFPLAFSAQKKLEANPAIALQEADMPWFFDLKEGLEDNKANPHFDIEEFIKTNVTKVQKRGATAVILYNTSSIKDNLSFNTKDRSEAASIPVVYVSKDVAAKYFTDPTATLPIKLNIELGEKIRTGHNAVGYINNNSSATVVIGAHFDHLGYGEDGNSMMRTGEKLIHNGADDNASGTAALIELARILKNSKAKNSNYLFLAFSGEELGLFGSKYYVDNPTIDLSSVNYMINLDMVGRLNDSTKALTIGGFGTSPEWSRIINVNDKKLPFTIHIDSTGAGPSDHTSFYRKDIPVLFFFTGTHMDYHRPSDDAEKINYTGELSVIKYVTDIVEKLNKQNQKLAFLKTKESQRTTTSFKVTLGIMPDYTFTGTGLKADGVTEGRPAANAGLKTGDIVIQLGNIVINSMDNYMEALNQFNKGDRTKVKYKRGNQTIEADVQF